MNRWINNLRATVGIFLLAVGATSVNAASPSGAMEKPKIQIIKVALLDMSSIAGPGMGPRTRQGTGMGPDTRQGIGMGPGTRQGTGMGPGMMGPGWGWGEGQGSGWMARGMMGPGMMGMGMMSIRTSNGTVKAGKVRFEVVNYSASLEHEMEVVAVDDLNAALPYNYNTAKVVVPKAKELGEIEHMKPGNVEVLELTLPAGNYLLVCNLPGHYAAGMVSPLTVTP